MKELELKNKELEIDLTVRKGVVEKLDKISDMNFAVKLLSQNKNTNNKQNQQQNNFQNQQNPQMMQQNNLNMMNPQQQIINPSFGNCLNQYNQQYGNPLMNTPGNPNMYNMNNMNNYMQMNQNQINNYQSSFTPTYKSKYE